MTTEGEQQEAVCGTCGQVRHIVTADEVREYRAREHRHQKRCNGCGLALPIPAPVVPSDDGSHERDEERWLLTPGKWQPEESAPPTPSQDAEDAADADMAAGRTHSVDSAQELVEWLHAPQDAEGEGSKALLLQVKRMTGREPVGMGDLLNILTHPDCIEFTEAWLESAIRAPYEALVKAVGLFIRRATAEECFGCGAPIHHGAGHEVGCAVVSLYVALESPGSRS